MFKGSEYLYYFMYIVGFAISLIINLKDCGRYRLDKKKAVIYTVCMFLCGIAGAMLMGKIYTAFCRSHGFNGVSAVAIFGAVVFAPIFMLVFFILEKSDYKKNLDMLTPCIYITLTCAKFGCFLDGCCFGIPSDFGFYNPYARTTVFPVQLFEVASMIIMLILTQLYLKKSRKAPDGFAYPLTTAVYCAMRFGWEFLRYYETDEMRHAVLGLTFWQSWCAVIFALSAIAMVMLKIKQQRNTQEKST